MNHFCQQASKLVSDAYERRLAPGERLRLRWHLLICSMCRAYERDIRRIESALRKLRGDPPEGTSLPEEERQRISKALKSDTAQGSSSTSS